LEIYRANGCAYCHSQQVGQTGTVCDVMLGEAGTNQAPLVQALKTIKPGSTDAEIQALLTGLPKPVLQNVNKDAAAAAVKTLTASGAKASYWIVPVGPDIARGWGKRRTVAEDFLYDDPAMPGAQRIGPDLANVGVRLPDERWHLRHLYAPKSEVKGSTMPPYPYLFDRRNAGKIPHPDALVLATGFGAEPGIEIVPKPEAKALAAYLASLQATAPLFHAPLTVATAAPTATNGPTGGPVTNAPAK
jgi:hypothetical protein